MIHALNISDSFNTLLNSFYQLFISTTLRLVANHTTNFDYSLVLEDQILSKEIC